MTDEEFGNQRAYPLPAVHTEHSGVEPAAIYGIDAGLTIKQHVWLTLFAGLLGDKDVTIEAARDSADEAVPLALARMNEMP